MLLSLAALLTGLWVYINAATLFGSQNGIIRSSLALVFAAMILLRPKPEREHQSAGSPLAIIFICAICGVGLTATGIIFHIRQLEWLGIIITLWATLSIALPPAYSRDIPRALFILYWMAPIPSALFTQLQLFMQSASVAGSAWLLQLFNIRVWGDGLVLRTGVYTFEVPAWCSGMRTATTVFILSLAIGILRRMRSREITIFTAWSLFHALLLNIIRICIMVILAPHTNSTGGLKFLHDSAGFVVVGGILTVYLEMLYIENHKRWQHHIKSEINQAQFENISEYPPFWKRILKHRRRIAVVAAILALLGTIAFRVRPYHRAMMIGDVVNELRDRGDLHNALRGAEVVAKLIPDNIEWAFTYIRLKMIAGQHQQVVDTLRNMQNIPERYRNIRKVLMAYSLLYLGQIEQAAAIVEKLPEEIRNSDPRVAMIMAEMALRGDNPDAVAINVVNAAAWGPNIGRIRNLYPYLHVHRKWQAMADSDMKVPYNDPVQAFSITEAYMQLDQTPRVAEIVLQSIARWPTDMRALEPLYFMAIKRDNPLWNNHFANHLLRSIAVCHNPDKLYETMYKCFSLSRPDLAWQVYHRIQELNPHHPTLAMSAAKYGHKWFIFKKRFLNMPSAMPTDTIDLKPFYTLAQYLPQWRGPTSGIPLAQELSVSNTTPVRKRFLARAIKDFQTEISAGHKLSLDMQYLYAQALEMNSRIDLARLQLKKIVKTHPNEKENTRIMLSEMYERKGDWINVYETLRTYLANHESNSTNHTDLTRIALTWPPPELPHTSSAVLHIKPLLRLTKAQMELKMHLAALHTARKTAQIFPYSARAIENHVKALMQLGNNEEALKILQQSRLHDIRALDILEAEALLQTERFSIIPSFCRKAMLHQPRIPTDTPQQLTLQPAELCLLWHRISIPSEQQFREYNMSMQLNLGTASPGLHRMLETWIKGYETHCASELAGPRPWVQCARDPMETATSLNQLTLMLCRNEQYQKALIAARAAVSALPNEPILWQILISLANGDTDTIAHARHNCPDDAHIWLAELVAKTHPEISSDFDAEKPANIRWLDAMVAEALNKKFTPDIITRAGEYLWRGGMHAQANKLARYVTDNARGLLPAYIFAMHCAIASHDKEWAIKATERAIKASANPTFELYRNYVNLKADDAELATDPGMINALRNLRKTDPDNPDWAQMLGYIRFQRGGWEIIDAMFQMQSAIKSGATNAGPYLIAAESSRLLRNYDRAIDILEHGRKKHPDNLALLNNLAFTMALSPKHKKEARKLLPHLIKLANNNPSINDTIATIYINTSQIEKARRITAKTLRTTIPGSAIWFRAKTHLAKIAWKQNQKAEAIVILNSLLKNPKQIPDEDLLNANTLLARINGKCTKASLATPIETILEKHDIPAIQPEQ